MVSAPWWDCHMKAFVLKSRIKPPLHPLHSVPLLRNAFIHTCYNCINCEVGLRGSSLQRNLPDHLHLWCLFFTSVHFRAFRILSYCPYGCSREDKGLLRAIWREKRAQLENCLPTYPLQSMLHLPTPDTTTYYFSKSISFCFSFVCLFFGGCFVCFLSCKNNSELFFSFFWIQLGKRSSVEFLGPVIECGCSNIYLCFVSFDFLIH